MAGIHSLSELLTSSFLQCPLCSGQVSKPVILPCLHSACEACMHKYVTESTAGGKFQCMVCKTECEAPNNGHHTAIQNHFLAFLQELAACHNKSTKHCEYCSYDQKSVEAKFRCIECRDNLCENCLSAHRRTKVTRNHEVLTFDDIRKGDKDIIIRDNQQVMCSAHGDEPYKFFCSKCDKLICRECKVSEHDNHMCVDLKKSEEKYRQQFKMLLQTVDGKIPGIVEYSLFLKDYIKHVDETNSKMKEDIEKQAEVLHEMIDEHKEAMIQQLDAATQNEREANDNRTTKTDDVTCLLKGGADFVHKLLEYGNADEILSLRQIVTDRLAQLGNIQMEAMDSKLNLYYSTGTATAGNMETLFGKVDIFNIPLNDKSVKTIKNDTSPNPPTMPLVTSLPSVGETVTEVLNFESKGRSDSKDIWPTGVDVDHDGNIVVLDRDNKKVKVFDGDGKLVREFGHKGLQILQCPYDLTIMNDGCIAITDYEDEDVKIFTHTGVFVKSIKSNFKYPRGITTNSQGQLIVVDCHSHRLTIHDPESGDIVNEISGKASDSCDMFTDPYYVVTSPSDYIIVTDWSAPNIKFFDSSGRYLTQYGTYGVRKDQVLQPYGVCTDAYGYIFVADNQNHRIHLLAPDGKFIRFLVSKQHGLWHPMAVAIDKRGQLVVTEALGKVKIFKYM